MRESVAPNRVDVDVSCPHCGVRNKFTVFAIWDIVKWDRQELEVGPALPTIRRCSGCSCEYRIMWRVGIGSDPATRIEG